jgi:hypothetical protein
MKILLYYSAKLEIIFLDLNNWAAIAYRNFGKRFNIVRILGIHTNYILVKSQNN